MLQVLDGGVFPFIFHVSSLCSGIVWPFLCLLWPSMASLLYRDWLLVASNPCRSAALSLYNQSMFLAFKSLQVFLMSVEGRI